MTRHGIRRSRPRRRVRSRRTRGSAVSTVSESATGLAAVTGGDGRYSLLLPAGVTATIVERNLSGFVSLSPDTVGPAVLAAGDTLVVEFRRRPRDPALRGRGVERTRGRLRRLPAQTRRGDERGGRARRRSPISSAVTARLPRRQRGRRVRRGRPRPIDPADLDMDPAAGKDHVCLIVRLFIPPASPVGVTLRVTVDAVQTIEGTPITSSARAFDAVVVTDGGLLALAKSVDAGVGRAGDRADLHDLLFEHRSRQCAERHAPRPRLGPRRSRRGVLRTGYGRRVAEERLDGRLPHPRPGGRGRVRVQRRRTGFSASSSPRTLHTGSNPARAASCRTGWL